MDRAGVYLRVGVYIVLCKVAIILFANPLVWLGGYFVAITLGEFLSAITVNWVALQIYGGRKLADLGLPWSSGSMRNLALGAAGGMGAAALVLSPPLFAHVARFRPAEGPTGGWGAILFIVAMLFAGSAGEEIMFHGYAFQLLLAVWGSYATIFTVGALFAVMHGANPNATWLALGNTAGFGILFGYAFLRSGDLWLPIGLHFGWNFTLPLFGVNVSGLTMKLTSHEMEWSVGSFWSGGDYGPEGSILTTIVLAALAVFIWKAPVGNQKSEVFPCVPGSPFSS
jgi:membrane protease YdiL (CAAX protease family)